MAIVGINVKESNAQKVVLMSMTVVVVAAFVERYSGVKETASVPEIIIGAFVAATLLLLFSYVLPEFATGLAVVAAVTMVITRGQPFWDAINKVTGKPLASPGSPSSPLAKDLGPSSTGTFSSQPLPTFKPTS